MSHEEFQAEVFSGLEKIQRERASRPQIMRDPTPEEVPEGLPALLSIVRTFAEDLILCTAEDAARVLRKQDQATLRCVEILTTDFLQEDDIASAIQLAHASTPQDTPLLPFHALCSYLIELCNGLEPGPPNED